VEYLFFAVVSVPYLYLCFLISKKLKAGVETEKALRESAQESAFNTRQRSLREIAVDGISYAAEQAAKARKSGAVYRPETKLQDAMDYVVRKTGATHEDAAMTIESMIAKIGREGATGNETVR
jgi:hypothetical protein